MIIVSGKLYTSAKKFQLSFNFKPRLMWFYNNNRISFLFFRPYFVYGRKIFHLWFYKLHKEKNWLVTGIRTRVLISTKFTDYRAVE